MSIFSSTLLLIISLNAEPSTQFQDLFFHCLFGCKLAISSLFVYDYSVFFIVRCHNNVMCYYHCVILSHTLCYWWLFLDLKKKSVKMLCRRRQYTGLLLSKYILHGKWIEGFEPISTADKWHISIIHTFRLKPIEHTESAIWNDLFFDFDLNSSESNGLTKKNTKYDVNFKTWLTIFLP